MTSHSNKLWKAPTTQIVPSSARTPTEIAGFAVQLRQRDVQQIVEAFESEYFEMASTFVWSKAMAALRSQLATLGADFVGEMLQRPDIQEFSDITTAITDSEAISLAENLGMVKKTDALRLRQSHEIVTHFAGSEAVEDFDEDRSMNPEEAVHCLRTCVQTILGHPRLEVAHDFARFRRSLEQKTLSEDDEVIVRLVSSPYFYWKTTLSVLLALIKSSRGAQLEHVVRNTTLILDLLWSKLRKPERWQAGQTYAELFSEGKKDALKGLKHALLKVSGFDYVPENLRSSTFARAAKDVLQAHEGLNNFFTEEGPMHTLASLGTTIPSPAFPVCMTATLSVWLGNSYGHSYSAQSSAGQVLEKLSKDRWIYYLDECLPTDRQILFKLTCEKPSKRWVRLVKKFSLKSNSLKDIKIRNLLRASTMTTTTRLHTLARRLT